MHHNNNIRDRVMDLSRNDLTPTQVHDNPLIHPCSAVKSREALQDRFNPPKTPPGLEVDPEQKSKPLIQDLWACGTNCILYMWVVNIDAAPYVSNNLEKIISVLERDKIVSTYMLSSSIGANFTLFSSQQTAFWVTRQRSQLNAWPNASPLSGGKPNPGHAAMYRVG